MEQLERSVNTEPRRLVLNQKTFQILLFAKDNNKSNINFGQEFRGFLKAIFFPIQNICSKLAEIKMQ